METIKNPCKSYAYIGFAMRAGKFRIGSNAIDTLKRAKLMIVCNSISENSLKSAKKQAEKFGCKLFMTGKDKLEDVTHKENAKVMAITDKELASAIINDKDKDFTEIISGEKNG